MTTRAGYFLAIDGPSGVGKTTVTSLVAAKFTEVGMPSLATKEPTTGGIGQLAREGTHEYGGFALACLVTADRYHHLATQIRPALAEGTIVVCDRYLSTSLVLQTGDGVPEDFIWQLNRYADRPDLTVILTGDPAQSRHRAAARGTYSRFHDGGDQAGAGELDQYIAIAERLRTNAIPNVLIDVGQRDADEVAAQIVAAVNINRSSAETAS
jgi:dTMP kinase